MHTENADSTPRDAADELTSFIPCSLSVTERVAQHFARRYRRKTAEECRHAVARMYGHASWPALQAAVAAGVASRTDEEESAQAVGARRRLQYDVALVWLGGIDAEAPAAQSAAATSPAGSYTIAQRYDPQFNRKRLDRARHAYNVAYAREVVDEVRPTAREALPLPPDDDEIDLMLRVDLLPRALKSWLGHHRPLLSRWAGVIGGMRVRQRCPAELLDFSFAWGELCLQHENDIPKALQIYPIALCAQWYAWLACLKAPLLKGELEILECRHASETQRSRAQHAVQQAIREEEAQFMRAQPREDLCGLSRSAREQQMQAGHAALRRSMSDAAAEHTIKTILAKPSWLSLSPAVAAR